MSKSRCYTLCSIFLWLSVGQYTIAQDPSSSTRLLAKDGLIETSVVDATESQQAMVYQLDPCDPLESLPQVAPRGACDSYLDSYRIRIEEQLTNPVNLQSSDNHTSTRMWWDELINGPLGFSDKRILIDVESLTTSALAYSPRISALVAEPHIRQSAVTIADAEFDPSVFLKGKFVDTNDPVGNELTTGDASRRYRDETFSAQAGVRRRTRTGGEFELIQRGGFQRNNSVFLLPNPQGTTRLELNYTQPLKRNGGRAINRSKIIVAQLRTHQATSETRSELENHLLEVTTAYWNLYLHRALYLQQQKLVGTTRDLYDMLQSRSGFDAPRRNVLRARAALASRQSGLTRSAARIKDAQSRLRMLVGSHQLIDSNDAEWLTGERPLAEPIEINPKQSLIDALDHRADISAALQEIHEVTVRVGAAKNQVLPQLDLLLGTYVAGLDRGRDPLGAFENQFSDGRPGFSVGLAYESPVGNRAARSRLNRNRWELHQVIQQFRQTTEQAITEVEVATRETHTAYQDLLEKKIAVDATISEVAYLNQRYQELPGREDSLVLLVDNLLDAQDRLAEHERLYAVAQVAYAMSWVKLRKATGTLLRFDAPPKTDLPLANGTSRTPQRQVNR